MFRAKRKKALSFVELMVTVSIFSIIGIFLTYITLEVAYKIRQSVTEIPSLEQNFRTLNFVRTQLLPADWTSLDVSADGSTISFLNPAAGATSTLRFNGDDEVLEYDPDVSVPDDDRLWSRNIQGRFVKLADARTVQVQIRTEGRDRHNNVTFFNFEENLKVRN